MSRLGLTTLLVPILCAACGGGDTGARRLVITEPTGAGVLQFCSGDDQSEAIDGVQITVRVSAEGFRDGDVVRISFDGAAPDPGLAQTVVGERVTFSQLTLPEGTHSLAARSEDGQIQSNVLQFEVDTDAPEVSFVTPTDGRTLRGPQDDADPSTPTTVEYDVDVFADVDDGVDVNLTLIDPSGGEAVQTPVAASAGHAVFPVSFTSAGNWRLRAEVVTACGNAGAEEITVIVIPGDEGPSCDVSITPSPLDLGPGPDVLNAAMDPDPMLALFQATIDVTSDSAVTVELFVNMSSAGTRTLSPPGSVSYPIGLEERLNSISARCSDVAGTTSFSTLNTVLVDITPPTCSIGAPPNGAILTPADDVDPSDPDIDFDISLDVGGPDVEGNDAEIAVGLTEYSTTVSGGVASVTASLNSAGDYTITGSAVDDAGNTCSDSIDVSVDVAGCAITWTAPTSTITADSDPATPGVQIDATIEVSAECAGRDVTLSNCDVGGPITVTATAGPTPTATFNDFTFCTSGSCDQIRLCTASVTDPSGITTSQDASVHVDTVPPNVMVTVSNPAVACGSTVSPGDDVDPTTSGTQVTVRLFNTVAVSRWVEVTGPAGPPPDVYTAIGGTGEVDVTLYSGTNTIVGFATDSSGLTGSGSCTLSLSDLAVAITTPIDGATLGTLDGTVSGMNLLVDICGTVGEPASSMVTVLVDMAPVTTVTPDAAGNWCANGVSLSSGTHLITADGVASMSGNTGSASITVTVDVTPPPAPTGFAVVAAARNAADLSWTAPSDGGAAVDHCIAKRARAAITEGTFATSATVANVPGAMPGSPMMATATPLQLGAWHFGLKCFDDAGNGSPLVTAGPITLQFTASAAIGPEIVLGYDTLDAYFGYSLAGADLDDDGYTDLVVGAPNAEKLPAEGLGEGLVYVFMGGPSGISSDPAWVIRGNDPGGEAWFGVSLARVDWNGDGVDDIAIGSPYEGGYQGAVRIFFGDAFAWAPGTLTGYLDDTDADAVISAPAAGGGPEINTWFNFGGLGWAIATVNFDGDTRDDLLIGVVGGGGFKGGAVVVFGAGTGPSVSLPDGLAAAGTSAFRFTFTSGTAASPFYGSHVANLGILGHGPPGSDTREDVAIAPESDFVAGSDPVVGEERFFVFYGRAAPAVGTITTVNNPAAEEQIIGEVESDGEQFFGNWLGAIADQGGDGRRDLVVTAWGTGGIRVGATYIVPGGTGTPGGTQVVTDLRAVAAQSEIGGVDVNRGFGVGFANPGPLGGDIDGDGSEDLVVSSMFSSSNNGTIWFWHGGSIPTGVSAMSGATSFLFGPMAFVNSTTAEWTGDHDGDGLLDVTWADAMYRNSSIVNQSGVIQVLY